MFSNHCANCQWWPNDMDKCNKWRNQKSHSTDTYGCVNRPAKPIKWVVCPCCNKQVRPEEFNKRKKVCYQCIEYAEQVEENDKILSKEGVI